MKENKKFKEYATKKVLEIKIWLVIAITAPMTALALIFFSWIFGNETLKEIIMVAGSSIMFAVSVFWWIWVMHSMTSLINLWKNTEENVSDVKIGIKEIKEVISQIFKINDK